MITLKPGDEVKFLSFQYGSGKFVYDIVESIINSTMVKLRSGRKKSVAELIKLYTQED